ncbi:MAG: hemerythrin domain-containing protein [Planctomycetaceae bacterium]
MRDDILRSDLSQFVQEHEHLASRIGELRTWIGEVSELGIPRFGEMGDRLRPLHHELRSHFEHEEKQGYLSDALTVAPDLANSTQGLVLEHSQLLKQLDVLVDRLHQSEPPFDSWQQACAELDTVLDLLNQHETQELSILAAAVNHQDGCDGR